MHYSKKYWSLPDSTPARWKIWPVEAQKPPQPLWVKVAENPPAPLVLPSSDCVMTLSKSMQFDVLGETRDISVIENISCASRSMWPANVALDAAIYIYVYIGTYTSAKTCWRVLVHTLLHTLRLQCITLHYINTYVHTYIRTNIQTYVHTNIHTYISLHTTTEQNIALH